MRSCLTNKGRGGVVSPISALGHLEERVETLSAIVEQCRGRQHRVLRRNILQREAPLVILCVGGGG
jgi:hypothetical protein